MITQQHGTALGSKVVFSIVTTETAVATRLLARLRRFLHDYEARFSRFLPGSELARLNQQAGAWVEVSPELRAFMTVSNQMQPWSDGWYNPFVLPDLQRAGYLGSLTGSYGQEASLDMRTRQAPYQTATVALTDHAVQLPAGTAFDSGGLGKGYALDQLAQLIEGERMTDYWVSLGGDLIGRGHDDAGRPWTVTLDMIDELPVVTLDPTVRTAIATSTIRKRRGKDWHHLIDPTTGQPSQTTIEAVSVIAPSGVEADIAAKSLLLADTQADAWWQRHPLQAAYLQTATTTRRLG